MSTKTCAKLIHTNLELDERKTPQRDKNMSHNFLPSFAHKLVLKKTLCDNVSDADKRIRIMKSFQRILGSDTKATSYTPDKSTIKNRGQSKRVNQRRLTNTPSITV